jgi:hypothetical protein
MSRAREGKWRPDKNSILDFGYFGLRTGGPRCEKIRSSPLFVAAGFSPALSFQRVARLKAASTNDGGDFLRTFDAAGFFDPKSVVSGKSSDHCS